MALDNFLSLPKSGPGRQRDPFYSKSTSEALGATSWSGDHLVFRDYNDDGSSTTDRPSKRRRQNGSPEYKNTLEASQDTPTSSSGEANFISLLDDDKPPAKSSAKPRDEERENRRKRKRHSGADLIGMQNSGTERGWASSPWQRRTYSKNHAVALHQEIHDFVKYVEPTDAEKKMRADVIDRISSVITGLWPYAKVELFGSVAAGIFLPTSDIDMVVHGKWDTLPLNTLGNALSEANIPSKMQILSHARVPIIKLKDASTSLDIDISFNMTNGPEEAARIQELLKLYPPLKPLTLVVKQLLAQRMLNEVYTGGIGSYAVLLLIMSFLQMHPRQEDLRDANLGVLLIEFFELYGIHFNYDKVVISTLNGGKYFPKRGHWFDNRRPFLLAIENPRSTDEDVTKNSFAIESVRRAFEHAFFVLTSAFVDTSARGIPKDGLWSHASLLSLIVKFSQEVVDFRSGVESRWGNKTDSSRRCQSPMGSKQSSDMDIATEESEDDAKITITEPGKYSPSLKKSFEAKDPAADSANEITFYDREFFEPPQEKPFVCDCKTRFSMWERCLKHLRKTKHMQDDTPKNSNGQKLELLCKANGERNNSPDHVLTLDNASVKVIVGERGKMLKMIAQESGAGIRVSSVTKSFRTEHGTLLRKVSLSGATVDILKAKRSIETKLSATQRIRSKSVENERPTGTCIGWNARDKSGRVKFNGKILNINASSLSKGITRLKQGQKVSFHIKRTKTMRSKHKLLSKNLVAFDICPLEP